MRFVFNTLRHDIYVMLSARAHHILLACAERCLPFFRRMAASSVAIMDSDNVGVYVKALL